MIDLEQIIRKHADALWPKGLLDDNTAAWALARRVAEDVRLASTEGREGVERVARAIHAAIGMSIQRGGLYEQYKSFFDKAARAAISALRASDGAGEPVAGVSERCPFTGEAAYECAAECTCEHAFGLNKATPPAAQSAQIGALREALEEVRACMLRGGDGQEGDFGWNITRLNKARPTIRAALSASGADTEAQIVAWPKLTDSMIRAAADAHYGKGSGANVDGISMTAHDRDWSFRQFMKRIWPAMKRAASRSAVGSAEGEI